MKVRIFFVLYIGLVYALYSQELKKEYYDNGNIKAEYYKVDGMVEGVMKFYYKTGELQGEINYFKGKQDGRSILYFPSGKLLKEMSFKNGEQYDTMKIYYESGNLHEVSIINEGNKTGYYSLYYQNGNMQVLGNLKAGVLHDTCTYFYEDGRIKEKGSYYQGRKIGVWKEFDELGLTQKDFGPPKIRVNPEKIKLLTLKADTYTIEYPDFWEVANMEDYDMIFLAKPYIYEGVYCENITIVKQKSKKNLEGFIKSKNSELIEQYKTLKVERISEQNGYIDVIYSYISNRSGKEILIKSWTRYFKRKNVVFQMNFYDEEEKFDGLLEEVTLIYDSFKLSGDKN